MSTLRAVSNADDTSGPTNLWVTDGTAAGTIGLTGSGAYSSDLLNTNSVHDFTVLPTPSPPQPSHLVINLIPDASVANAPVGFWSAMTAAVQFFDNAFADPITVNIAVGWDEIGGSPLVNGNIGEGGPVTGSRFTYDQVRATLVNDAKSGADMTALASLSAADPTNGGSFFLGSAEEKALGLTAGNAAAVDGEVGFQSDPSYSFTFDPNNRAIAGDVDFIGVAEHEIAHAMGRDPYLGLQSNIGDYSILDLYRYSSPGVHDFTLTDRPYFSIDRGITTINTALLPSPILRIGQGRPPMLLICGLQSRRKTMFHPAI